MLSALAGCNTDGQTDSTDDSGETTAPESEQIVEFIDVVKDGVAINVVYPALSTAAEVKTANGIVSSIKSLSGVIAKTRIEPSPYDASTVEIVVGNTEYPESQKVMKELGYSEGIIEVVGNKIIILANDEECYDTLATRFAIAMSSGKDKNKNIRIAGDYNIHVSENELVASIPMVSGRTPDYVKDAGNGSYVLMFENADTSVVDSYLSALKAGGYAEYAKSKLENNYFYTYTNEETAVTVMLTDYDKEMKVVVDSLSNTALPTRESDNKWSAVSGMTTTISQLGLYYDGDFNGMSYVIRLADGSFIVIDGGHGKPENATRLYNVMRKQSPDPNKIVIAAWFFTHGHSDHTGFFKSFGEKYASKVTVEQFVYNFPSGDELANSDQSGANGSVGKYFKKVPVVKAHAGQEFYIRNSKITMLYTNDLWVYGDQALSTANEASLVFSVELEGKKFMVLGDYYDDLGILRNLYTAKTLKSDIMQVSHHGISNCGTALYPIIASEWALWPLGTDYVEEYDRVISEHKINAYMKKMDKNKVFMAKDDIVILTVDNGSISAQVFDTDEIYLAS